MEFIKSFLRKIDVFGVPYSFKYKSEEKYTTSTGGFVLLLFLILSVYMILYYLNPFLERKNYTSVYYTLKMPNADEINFDESKTGMAYGFNCWTGNDGTTPDQLFKIDFKYIHWKLDEQNEYQKTLSYLGSHPCTKQDFYNDFNETFEASSIYNYQCLDDPSISVEGIWTSEVFSYFQFEVNAKNKSDALLKKIYDYLMENDCKFQVYFADHTIDIDDYKTPIKSYVEAMFIQLNPTMSIRRNMYFMNQYLFNDDNFWTFMSDNEELSIKKTLFSRLEEYSLLQGEKRHKNLTDYTNYVKLYIRADTQKRDVKRRYQKINEFCADATSLLATLFQVLIIIFEYLNQFWGEQALSKKMFFFQDFDQSLNIKDKNKKIKQLLNSTEEYYINTNNNITANNNNNQNIEQKFPPKNLNPIKKFKIEKVIYNSKKITCKNLRKFNEKVDIFESMDNYEKISNSYKGKEYNLNSKDDFNILTKSRNNDLYESNKLTDNNTYTTTSNDINDKETCYGDGEIEEVKTEFKYGLFTKLQELICKCCLSKKTKINIDLNEKATELLDNKLDVALYVRNMILLEIVNEILLDPEIKEIVNFLARPIISLKNKTEEEQQFSLFYHRYNEVDFDKFNKEVIELSNKTKKSKKELKLLAICNKHLRQINI